MALPQPLQALLESEGLTHVTSAHASVGEHVRVAISALISQAQTVNCTWGGLPVVAQIAVGPEARRRHMAAAQALQTVGPHPSIVPLLASSSTVAASVLTWPDVGDTTLQSLLRRRGGAPLPEWFARHLFAQLVCAVEHLHMHDTVHRRIACASLAVTSAINDVVQLRDFASAAPANSAEADATEPSAYTAPECRRDPRLCSAKADVWSCGMVLLALVSGALPEAAAADARVGTPRLPPGLPPPLAALLADMLRSEPRLRPSIGDVRRHEWLREEIRLRRASTSDATPLRRTAPHARLSVPPRGECGEHDTELERSESSASERRERAEREAKAPLRPETSALPPRGARTSSGTNLGSAIANAFLGVLGRTAV